MASARHLVAFSLAAFALGGCAAILGFEDTTLRGDQTDGGETDGPGGDDGGGGGDASAGRLTASASLIVVRRGASASVDVDLVRGTDVTGDVDAQLTDLPAGVTAMPAPLHGGVSKGTITVSATKTAVLGPATIHLGLTPPVASIAPVPLSLLVADAAGALDVTFDADGFLSDGTRGNGSTFYALTVQPDGKIVAGGTAQMPAGWLVKRYGAAGAPDGTFAAGAGTPSDGDLRALALDASGNVIAVGTSTGVITQQLTVVRYTPSGALDAKFAGGLVRLSNVDAPQGSNGFAVAVGTDGSVIAAGSAKSAAGENAIAVRFKSDGTRDAAFGTNGILTVAKNRFVGASIEPGGAIVLGGTDETATFTYFLTRRTPTGAADPAFGTAGVATFGSGFRAQTFARLPDGSFALAGDAQAGGQYTAGVASNAGVMKWVRAPALATAASFFGVGAQQDGQVIVAGHATGATAEARVMRLAAADGTIDATFGNGGTSILAARPGSMFDVTLFAALVQPDGRILVGGNKSNAGATLFRLWP